MLLEAFLNITAGWREVFPRERSFLRASAQALGSLLCLGRTTLTRVLAAEGRQQLDWSADCYLHSRSSWSCQELFRPILASGLKWCEGRWLGVALDETRLKKSGRKVAQASYQRDPLSPPFQVNLMWGLRFLQASLLLPLHRFGEGRARAVPIRFESAPALKRPRRNASREERRAYERERRRRSVSTVLVAAARAIRAELDRAGARVKTLVLALDGSFCNRTVFRAELERTTLLARARKDARLCGRAEAGSRRFYSVETFTPDEVRRDATIAWRQAKLWFGGKRRKLRYKLITGVFWRGGAQRRELRLIVLAPTPYRHKKRGRWLYRQPAYLLSTELEASPKRLLQIYLDRWQIEVNHREEKDTIGVGQAQVRHRLSVERQPALCVAAYAALLMAGLEAYGCGRGSPYPSLPKWRKRAARPSCLDLVTLLREQAAANPKILHPYGINPSLENLALSAAA